MEPMKSFLQNALRLLGLSPVENSSDDVESGHAALTQKDYPLALKKFKRAATKGDSAAQTQMVVKV